MQALISHLRLLRRFRSPHHPCREFVMRTSSVLSIPKFVNATPRGSTNFGIGTPAAARFTSRRAVVVAMLFGPLVGALLAYGAVAAEEPNAVTIDNFTFTPPQLTIAVGTTVKWLNHDDIPHTVIDKGKAFRSKALDTDDSYSFTFASAGTYDYFCGLHPHMQGKIIVK